MVSTNFLAEGGLVAAKLPSYELRPQQLAMAEAVGAAFADQQHLLVEAGTGVGKSFAYLIPAIELAVHHGKRVLVSTHTIALQEQLIQKDIPFLRKVFPEEFSAVLVKGRSNYIGLRRLSRASKRQELLFDTKGQLSELWKIEDWAYKTQDGSRSDLEHEPSLPVWDRVKSEHDDCLGRKCPTYQPCFYQRARRRAAEAQLLIVNHAMLFSDIAVRREGSSILPDYEYVVLDEAHTVESVAGDHLGTNLTNTQIYYLLNSLHNPRTGKGLLRLPAGAKAIAAVHAAHGAVEDYFGALQDWLAEHPGGHGRLREPPSARQKVSAALVELRLALTDLRDSVESEDDRLELAATADRCKGLAAAIADWHGQTAEDWVYWVEAAAGPRQRVTLCGRPIDVGPLLKTALFDVAKSVVMTSATMTVARDDPFAYLRSRLGLETVRTLCLGSPFNYREQVTAYVETDIPDPADTGAHIPAACEAIKKYLCLSEGRAFVLFTSYAMMKQCAERLTSFLEEQHMPLLLQGSGLPRTMMLDRFRAIPRSVLFGADTFWAGVDVPGEALSNVIIVKLPFAVPNHPVVEARMERIRQAGGNPFMEFQLPEAVLKLKQGVGRLIRTRTDRGIVVILDPRVVTKHYGRMFLEALPDCEVVINGQRQQPRAKVVKDVHHS